MAITITPSFERQFLEVSGDIEELLPIPADPPRAVEVGQVIGAYFIALSDGSLMRVTYEERPQYAVIVEGAGRVKIDDAGNCVNVDWNVEWLVVAPSNASVAVMQKSTDALPLFRRTPICLVQLA